MQKNIYLDHNATTPIRPAARDAVIAAMDIVGNASSTHSHGRECRKIIETARRQIASTLDVGNGQIIFNSGATEGNNTILKGFTGQRILVSATEHPSIIESGVVVEKIAVDENGLIDLNAFSAQLQNGAAPALVSVMYVNNETGVIQPITDIARLAKEAGAVMHSDCVQAYGRIPFTRESLGVDIITLSSHKIGGPQGVGALVMAPRIQMPKLLEGGGQEKRQRAGTENIAGIAGFGAAVTYVDPAVYNKISHLRQKIETHIRASNQVYIWGEKSPRVANTTLVSVNGMNSETFLMAFDLEGISLSGGSACSSGTTKQSYVLKAMGINEDPNRATLRISLGHTTTEKDVEDFLTVWDTLRIRFLKD